MLLTAGVDGARVWDAGSFEPVTGVLRHGAEVRTAALSPDGGRVLTAGGEEARVWDARTGRLLHTLQHGGRDARIFSAAWSPDGGRAVTGGGDGTARVWDAATGESLLRLGRVGWGFSRAESVDAVAYGPDGRTILTDGPSTGSGSVRLWDAATGKPLADPPARGPAGSARTGRGC